MQGKAKEALSKLNKMKSYLVNGQMLKIQDAWDLPDIIIVLTQSVKELSLVKEKNKIMTKTLEGIKKYVDNTAANDIVIIANRQTMDKLKQEVSNGG